MAKKATEEQTLPLVTLRLQEITSYEHNPRIINEDAINAVKASILKYGYQQPIVVWGPANEVVVGHTRLIALTELGYSEIPVLRADHLTQQEVIEYRIIDNKSGEKSQWDYPKLKIEFQKIDMDQEVINMNFTPFDLDVIGNKEWETDHSLSPVEKITESNATATSKIVIECQQSDKQSLIEFLKDSLIGTEYEYVTIS